MAFVLEGLPDDVAVETLRGVFRDYPMPLELHTHWVRELRARFDARALDGVRVEAFQIAGASGDVERRATCRDGSVPALLTVHLTLAGSSQQLYQDGRSAHPRPGDLVFSSTQRPFTTSQSGFGRQFAFSFDYDELGLPSQRLLPLVGRVVRGDGGLTRVVAGYLRSLAVAALEERPPLQAEGLAAAREPATQLVRALLLSLHGDEDTAREPLAASLVERILQYADAHLDDPGLCTEQIAAVHGVSVRYVYLVLARHGITLGDWLRNRRLERAAVALRREGAQRRTVAGIAASVGFSDHAHFTRAFRTRYGMTPSQWRAG